MKIALYIEDGLEQIVLTGESDTEKAILGKLHDGSRSLGIHSGEFYPCKGGWTRHARQYEPMYGVTDQRRADQSTIIVLRPVPKSSEPEAGPGPEPANAQ